MADQYMDDETRARAMQLLGGGMAGQAGQQVNAPMRGGQISAQEAAAMAGQPMQPPPPPPQQTPYGGPGGQPGLGGPVQGYIPNGVPRPGGGQMTPEQAKKLAEMLRNRN